MSTPEIGKLQTWTFCFYVFHVEIKWGGKLWGEAKEKERKEAKISPSAKLYVILRGSFSI